MNEKIVFVRTSRGEDEARSRTAHLSKDIKRALLMVDGTATVAEIMKRSSPSLRGMLEDMFTELAKGGFIQDKAKVVHLAKMVVPMPVKKAPDEAEELDFTAAFRVPSEAVLREEEARLQFAAEEKRAEEQLQAERQKREEAARAQHEAAEIEARAVADEKARRDAEEQSALRAKAEREAAEAERLAATEMARKAEQHAIKVEAQARAVAQEHARLETEVAKLKAKAAADEQARLDAQAERREMAERVKADQEAAEAERKANALAARRAEQQAAEVKAEAIAHARAVAGEKAALEAEVAKLKAQAEAQAAAEAQARQEAIAAQAERLEAVSRVKAEQEAALRLDAERRAREEAERRVEQNAVQSRLEAEARAVEAEKSRLEEEVASLKAQAEAQSRARIDAEIRAKQDVEAARVRAEQEASRVREEAAQAIQRAREEALAREEAERVAMQAEVARVRAEQEALRIKSELDAQEQARLALLKERVQAEEDARAQAEQQEEARYKIQQAALKVRVAVERARQAADARAHDEAERLASETAEMLSVAEKNTARAAESEAQSNAEMLASVVRLNAKHAAVEQSVFSALDELAQQETTEFADIPEYDGSPQDVQEGDLSAQHTSVTEKRTTIAAVVFFDIVNYTKYLDSRQIELKQQFNQLLAKSLVPVGSGERISLDTGDGAAVGFLQHPTDALESAIHFRNTLMANKCYDYPDLRVRVGIHLGPVSLVKDVNGQINMLGDGINSAQRVMDIAGKNQIYVSRAYFDFVSSLSDEYGDLFRYRGAQRDKHGREFQIYELLDADEDEPGQAPSDHFDAFSFEAFDAVSQVTEEPEASVQEARQSSAAAEQLLMDAAGLGQINAAQSEHATSQAVHQTEENRPVEEYSYSESEARELADAQAAKWAEAERRAAESAVKKPEIITQTTDMQTPRDVAAKALVRRQPVAWGKLAAGLFVLLPLLLAIVPAVLPMQGYVAGIEQLLSSKLHQPVHIGHLAGRILPAPRLLLDDVSIGDTKQIHARQARVNFSFLGLFGAIKPVDSVDLDGVQVKGAALPEVSAWLQKMAGDHQYPVARITLAQGMLDADGIQFSDVDGELDFDSAGKFTLARLNGSGHKSTVEIHAAPDGKLKLSISLHDSALPLLPNWVFDDLNATGELTGSELRISDLDSRIRGGVLTGKVRINWRADWRVQGMLAAKAIPLQRINKLLDGDMDATANFQMEAGSFSRLADAAVLHGVFNVNKGLVSGVDIVETTRLRSRESLPGGRTHFDALSGELSYANDNYQFSRIKISDSVLQATGALTVAHQKLSGRMSADLTMRGGSAVLQIGGTTESPSLHVAR